MAVGDVDEVDVGAVTDADAADDAVAENAATGTGVGITAAATDANGTTNAISYSLDDDAGGRFAIDASSGVVSVADGRLLDHEAAASHTITVRATSADGSSSTEDFTIAVADVAENGGPTANPDDNDGDPVLEAGVAAGDPEATRDMLANDTDPDSGDAKEVVGVAAGGQSGPISPGVSARPSRAPSGRWRWARTAPGATPSRARRCRSPASATRSGARSSPSCRPPRPTTRSASPTRPPRAARSSTRSATAASRRRSRSP